MYLKVVVVFAMVVTVATMIGTTIGTPQNQWCEDGVEGERMDGGRW